MMQEPSGVLIVHKHAGVTSHNIVGAVRRLYHTRRVGHAGTLDPMATGVLVVLIGRAAKASEYLSHDAKHYRATLRLGLTTDTEDTTGTVLTTSNAIPTNEELQAVIKEYTSIKSTTKAAQVQYKENVEKYNQLKDSVKDEKESVEAELKALQDKVEPSIMERYLKKRANKIYPVLYEVRGNVCGACNMELPMSEINKLKNGEIIDCDQCGRLLYQSK